MGLEELETGQIIRLHIPWFGRERFYLIYQKTDADCILLNITGKHKGDSPEISQYPLKDIVKLPGYEKPLINLNVLVFIENEFLPELLRRVKQPEEITKLSKEEFKTINKEVRECFRNPMFSGNLYELKILPNRENVLETNLPL